jgi:hypothetical protein
VGVEIVENDVGFAIREGGDDMIQEAEKLDTTPTQLFCPWSVGSNGDVLAPRTTQCE